MCSLSTQKLPEYLFIALKNKLRQSSTWRCVRSLRAMSMSIVNPLNVRWQKRTITKSPYYYTILSNKYVVNDDDDTHWTGWITQLLSTQKRGRAVVRQTGKRKNEILRFNGVGRDAWIHRQVSNLLPAYAIHNNYNELQFNEKREHGKKLSTWFCLSIVIGFSRDDSRSGVKRMWAINGSCDKLWFHYELFPFCRNYELLWN